MRPLTKTSARYCRRLLSAPGGFTLVELLVAIVAGAAVIAGSTVLFNQDLLASRNLESFGRVRRQVTRARSFLELEASNAKRLAASANSITFSGLFGDGTPWSTKYDLVPAGSAGVGGVTFRGPFVLLRTGLPYGSDGRLDLSDSKQVNQVSVVLDQIADKGFVVTLPAESSPGVRVAINLAEATTTNEAVFSLVVPTDPRFGLLANTWTTTSPFTACSGSPLGCRMDVDGTTQEWHVPSITGTRITPVGSPAQVVVYFNRPRPTSGNAIRGTAGDTSSQCTRSRCYVDFGGGIAYTIGSPVNQLVFTNEVVTVARS